MIYEKIKLYEEREDVTLTAYVLDCPEGLQNTKKRGAVMICPGGAYLYCSDREGEPVAMAFAAMGYHTFVLHYSVYNENKDAKIPDLPEAFYEKKCKYPQPMLDIGKAMHYIAEHSDEWAIDVDKIALCGFSAGAHNCAMYSVYYDKTIITDSLGRGIKPVATVLGYMISDYRELSKVIVNKEFGSEIFEYSFKVYADDYSTLSDEILASLSPCELVSDKTPPMFLWATADDKLVNPIHTIKMAEALCRKNIPFELHMFEKGKHGICLATQATATAPDELDNDIENWIVLADKWLRKRMLFEFDGRIG